MNGEFFGKIDLSRYDPFDLFGFIVGLDILEGGVHKRVRLAHQGLADKPL